MLCSQKGTLRERARALVEFVDDVKNDKLTEAIRVALLSDPNTATLIVPGEFVKSCVEILLTDR